MMEDKEIQDLENLLSRNPFVLLDTSIVTEDYGLVSRINKSMKCRNYSDLHLAETTIPKFIAHYEKIRTLITDSGSYVTEEVLKEFEMGLTGLTKVVQDKIKPKAKTDEILRTIMWETVQEELGKTITLLKERQVFFLQPEKYKELLKFFKELAIYSKTYEKIYRERNKPWAKRYRFADESLGAAVIYFTATGENECPTTIVSRDHDIKKELRNAYQLFMAARPKEFTRLIRQTPFKGYFLTGEKELRYVPMIETNSPVSMGNLTPQFMGEQKFKELTIYAREVLDKVLER